MNRSGSPIAPFLAVCLALGGAAACAPTLHFNQSFLVAEELKLSSKNYASLKSTGESFNLQPILAQEGKTEKVVLLKVHGTYLVAGEGFKKLWRLWAGGRDEAKFKPIDLEANAPGVSGFANPTLEPAGKCALFKYSKGASQAQVFVTADGDVDAKRCSDDN